MINIKNSSLRCELICIVFIVCLVTANSLPETIAQSPVTQCEVSSDRQDSPNDSLDVPQPSARLPTSLQPISYNLTLHPHLHPPWHLDGRLELTFRVEESTSNVTLNMLNIVTMNDTARLWEISNDNTKDHEVLIVRQTFDQYRQMYIAELAQPLSKGSIYTFTIKYQGLIDDKLVGFYRSSYTTSEGEKRWLATTQFSPTDARRAFLGFDEPGFKSTFDITIVHAANLTAKSNMPAQSHYTRADGNVATVFQRTVKMSTFIVSFHVSDLVMSPPVVKIGPIDFSVWSRADVINQTSYAKSIGPAYVTFLQDYFNINYPLPKLEMVAIPDFKFNAMENWGFITYRESAMLLQENDIAPDNEFRVAYIVAHEVSHQWFGNLVTPKWWSELWLKEGFASFIGYLAMDHVEPEWGVMAKFVNDYQQSVMQLDSLQSSHPINVPVNHPDEISEIFDQISYEKGASILKMLHNFVGPETFRKGLSNYLKQLQYQSADQEDLWRHLHTVGNSVLPVGVTIKNVMDSWTYKKGYPVVNVTRDNNTFTLSQEQFLLGGSKEKVGWWIPITHTDENLKDFTDGNLKPKSWMTDDPTVLLVIAMNVTADQWVTFNLRGTGFFRVSYEPNDWLLLGEQLRTNKSSFPASHRATLLDDAFNLARSGYVSYDIALNMTRYLTSEEHFVPWEVALRGASYIYRLLDQDKAFGIYKSYLLSLVSPWYERLGFTDNSTAPYPERRARETAIRWACKLGHHECTTNAKLLFDAWLNNGDNDMSATISAMVQYPVLCTGIANGSAKEWEQLLQKMMDTSDPTLKNNIIYALGCTKELWLLSRYLELAFTPSSGIRKQDAGAVYGAVVGNPAGRDIGWRYIRRNWPNLVEYLGSNNRVLSRLISKLSHGFNSPQHLQELEQFTRDNRGRLAAAERAVRQTRETGALNVRWLQDNYDTVTDWLAQQQ